MSQKNNDRNRNKDNTNNKNPKKRRRKKKPKKSLRKKIATFFIGLIVIGTILVATVGGIVFGAIMKIIEQSPNLDLISVEPNVYTSIVYDINDKEIDRFHGDENREYVSLDKISPYLQNSIVSVEDERFYTHFGIDIKSILRAGYVTIKNKLTGSTGLQGASTITQQLIKNNVTKVSRNTIETKIQEQYLAVTYEKTLEEKLNSKLAVKRHILELYLNTIGLGHGYSGVQAASLGYFNKDAKDLTLAESACISAITNNPSLYSPRTQPENNKDRVLKILNHMLEQEMITKAEYDVAIAEDIYAKVSMVEPQKKVEGNVIHGYFEDAIFEQVAEDLQEEHNISKAQAEHLIYSGGLKIYSTKDSQLQTSLEQTYLNKDLFPDVVYKIDVTYTVSIEDAETGKQSHKDYRKFVKSEEEANTFITNKRAEIESSLAQNQKIVADSNSLSVQPQSSMVVMDYRTGQVVGMIGGRGEKVVNRGFNRAIDSVRQPGSVFKILASYAPAIDTGELMPASIIVDEPFDKAGYSPNNWYGEKYRGPSTIREGIKDSMNILAVRAMDMVGVDTAYQYLLNFGISTLEEDKHLSTALGGITYGVTQDEITAAYATIANGGNYYEPTLYKKVLDHEGNVILDTTTREPKRVIKETTAFLLTDMMEDVITNGTGRAAKFKNITMPVAGKTGTTQEVRDLTFVGYTPYYVAGIWFGYDRYDDVVHNMMTRVEGKRVIPNDRIHINIWREAMEAIHKDLPEKSFEPRPEGIIDVVICRESGLLATKDCKNDPTGNKAIKDMAVKGFEPTEYCENHTILRICNVSNKLAGDFCPKENIQFKSLFQFNKKVGEKEETKLIPPTEVCDIHIEESIEFDPFNPLGTDTTDIIEDTETTTSNVITIYPSDLNPQYENETEQTTSPKEIDGVLPSVPEDQIIEETIENIIEETINETVEDIIIEDVIIEETIGDPIIELP